MRLKVRSVVGLLPLCAAAVFGPEQVTHLDGTLGRLRWLLQARPELAGSLHPLGRPGHAGRHLLSVVNEDKLRRILSVMLDEGEFLRLCLKRIGQPPEKLGAGGRRHLRPGAILESATGGRCGR